MDNPEFSSYGKEGLQFGDNIHEAGLLTASDYVAAGTVVVRTTGKKWEPADASTCVAGKGLGVVIADVAKGTDVPFDVAIGGKFNGNLLTVDGAVVTEAQADVLRGQGIVVLKINPIDK